MKITAFNPKDGINSNAHRKENHFNKELALIAYTPETGFKNLATLRLYSTNLYNYACLWVNAASLPIHATGSARSGSQDNAIYSAARSAGITFDEQTYYVDASDLMDAIAEYLGATAYTIHHAHA